MILPLQRLTILEVESFMLDLEGVVVYLEFSLRHNQFMVPLFQNLLVEFLHSRVDTRASISVVSLWEVAFRVSSRSMFFLFRSALLVDKF